MSADRGGGGSERRARSPEGGSPRNRLAPASLVGSADLADGYAGRPLGSWSADPLGGSAGRGGGSADPEGGSADSWGGSAGSADAWASFVGRGARTQHTHPNTRATPIESWSIRTHGVKPSARSRHRRRRARGCAPRACARACDLDGAHCEEAAASCENVALCGVLNNGAELKKDVDGSDRPPPPLACAAAAARGPARAGGRFRAPLRGQGQSLRHEGGWTGEGSSEATLSPSVDRCALGLCPKENPRSRSNTWFVGAHLAKFGQNFAQIDQVWTNTANC